MFELENYNKCFDFVQDKDASALFLVLVILYGSYIAPEFPKTKFNKYQKLVIQFVVIFLLSIYFSSDTTTSLIIAGGLIAFSKAVSLLVENYEDLFPESIVNMFVYDPENNVKFINNSLAGCENIKLQNILDMLTGDAYLKQKNVAPQYKQYILKSGVENPLERLKLLYKIMGISTLLEINDDNAPYIASVLVSHAGFDVYNDCKLW